MVLLKKSKFLYFLLVFIFDLSSIFSMENMPPVQIPELKNEFSISEESYPSNNNSNSDIIEETEEIEGDEENCTEILPENSLFVLSEIIDGLTTCTNMSTTELDENLKEWLGENYGKKSSFAENLLHLAVRIPVRNIEHLKAKFGLISDLISLYYLNPGEEDQDGNNPLHAFATLTNIFESNGICEAITIIALFKQNINEKNNSASTPLHVASSLANTPVINALIYHGGAKVINSINEWQQTPLHCIAKSSLSQDKKLDGVRLLLQHKNLACKRDHVERTALHWAAKKHGPNSEIYEIILNADKRCAKWRDSNGKKPYELN